MHRTILSLISLSACLTMQAAEQIIKVTPQTLDSWSVSGADKNTLTQGQQLTLPAGSQLGREFSNEAVVVHLVTRPVPSAVTSDWPIIEVGPLALALVGDGNQVKLILGLDDDTQIELPWTTPADQVSKGIDLVLGYDPVAGTGLVGVGGQLQSYSVKTSSSPVETLLTAGDKSAWEQDTMEVLLLNNEPSTSATRVTNPPQTGTASKDALVGAVQKFLRKTGEAADPTDGSSSSPNDSSVTEQKTTLVVFTPPAVRHGRADNLRTIISQSKKL